MSTTGALAGSEDFKPVAEAVVGDSWVDREAGVVYAKGIGTHANSDIVYRLDPADVRFSATVGVDDFQRNSPYSSVIFQVEADGRLIYEWPVMRGDSEPQRVDLDVLGVQQLTLRVTDAGDGNNSDHADWAAPTVHRLP
ncbi:NPCBM/NEW2 domain-containing protein [Kribbella sp. NBC_00709]|uniref:NPCBM/NEW2 domain-containing protein n=1 Tax=Kribbella sp. NBC_00709 TaxID=2975972 RepID=UPI002E2E39E9|nr:NPCBM/NEW2 domain-containing protein [Kribbella sp. NBC_00709]